MDENKEKSEYVGYKNPPRHSQFKPGQSGNPKGRPKKKEDKSMEQAFRKELSTVVIVEENGKLRKITKGQYMVKKMVTMAMKGEMKAFKLSLALWDKIESQSGNGLESFAEAFRLNHEQLKALAEEIK